MASKNKDVAEQWGFGHFHSSSRLLSIIRVTKGLGSPPFISHSCRLKKGITPSYLLNLINHGTITVTAYYVGTWDDFPGLRNKTTCVYRNVRFHVPDVHQPPMIPAIIIHQLHSPLQGICGRLLFHVFHDLRYGWMATRNPVNSPLEVGSLAHYLHCNYTSQVGKLAGFLTNEQYDFEVL